MWHEININIYISRDFKLIFILLTSSFFFNSHFTFVWWEWGINSSLEMIWKIGFKRHLTFIHYFNGKLGMRMTELSEILSFIALNFNHHHQHSEANVHQNDENFQNFSHISLLLWWWWRRLFSHTFTWHQAKLYNLSFSLDIFLGEKKMLWFSRTWHRIS